MTENANAGLGSGERRRSRNFGIDISSGVSLDVLCLERVSQLARVAEAELGRTTASLWIGDNGRIALITIAGGAPLLLSA